MKTTMNKIISIAAVMAVAASVFAGCGSTSSDTSADTSAAGNGADTNASDNGAVSLLTTDITVVSREDGSGTRGAFVELTGVEEKDADGNKVDRTTEEAIVVNSTDVVMTQVSGNESAIGYISLGSLNDTVKAVQVEGVDPTVENIKAGTYTVSRPFNIAVKEGLSDAAQDFINYIMSAEGQAIVAENKYIPSDDAPEYAASGASGKVVVAGSSSVTPVMEKLAEAYQAINADVVVEVQQSDSTSGMKAAIDGTCDIGMASRELKDTELETLTSTTIAMDGIAVIVNNSNGVVSLTKDQIKGIFTGEITNWGDVQ
ncbi:MAG: substrate-binding domain-containing protein [Huintestinicola sp.]